MAKTLEALERREELDEAQRRVVEATEELLKIDAVATRLKEYDVDPDQLDRKRM